MNSCDSFVEGVHRWSINPTNRAHKRHLCYFEPYFKNFFINLSRDDAFICLLIPLKMFLADISFQNRASLSLSLSLSCYTPITVNIWFAFSHKKCFENYLNSFSLSLGRLKLKKEKLKNNWPQPSCVNYPGNWLNGVFISRNCSSSEELFSTYIVRRKWTTGPAREDFAYLKSKHFCGMDHGDTSIF